MSNSDTTTHYTLRYFNLTGISEGIRMILQYANATWTEENPSDWPSIKDDQPFGHLPVLIEKDAKDGAEFTLSESRVIEQYLARKFGLLPEDPKEAARVQELREQMHEVFVLANSYFVSRNNKVGSDLLEFYRGGYCYAARKLVEAHSRIMRENECGGCYFGESVRYIDLAFYGFIKSIRLIEERQAECEDERFFSPGLVPEFDSLCERIEGVEWLAPYVATRTGLAPTLKL